LVHRIFGWYLLIGIASLDHPMVPLNLLHWFGVALDDHRSPFLFKSPKIWSAN